MLTGWIDLSLQQLLLRLIAYVFIAGIHGFAVAATAYALGDSGPRHDGRLTPNPLIHLDILGTAVGVLFSFGWIRPVAVDPAELRTGRAGLVIVVAAGVAATLLAVVALRLIRPLLLPLLSDTTASAAFALIETIGDLSLWFAIFNVLPLPPLTGAHLLVAAIPAWREVVVKWQLYAGLALAVLAATKALAFALSPAYRLLAPAFIGQ